MVEFGLIERWKKMYFPSEDSGRCFHRNISDTAVTMEKILGVFLVYLAGISLAFLVLITEVLLYRYKTHFERCWRAVNSLRNETIISAMLQRTSK